MSASIAMPEKTAEKGTAKFPPPGGEVVGSIMAKLMARVSTPRTPGPVKNTAPVIVGRWRNRYLTFDGQQFVLLAAPTRSGKGVGFVIPNLLFYDHSCVVLDVKQENYNVTAGFRRAHGQEVYLFNPFAEDFRTARYNPLSAISDGIFRVGDILAIGNAMYPSGGHDSFWADSARNLFLGLVLLLCELHDARTNGKHRDLDIPDYPVTIGEVLRQSSGKGLPIKQHLGTLLVKYGPALSGACVDALNRFLANDDKVLASILSTFNAPLTIWANPIVDAATSENDFDLREVRKKKMTVYLGVTPDHLADAAVLLNLMFSQLVNLNTKKLPQDDPALKYQCLLLMDEFTAIGKVGIIAKAISYMAGYNLRLMAIIQSVSQLESVYGREDARTFMTNCAMQALYPPREQKDANEYSEMLGYTTVKSASISRAKGWGGRGGGPSESISDQRRALMLPQELKELGQDKEIVLLENTKPILADKIIYYKDPAFTSRLMPAPEVTLLKVEHYQARVENRTRDLSQDDLDGNGCLAGVDPMHLEVMAHADTFDLPQRRDDMSEDETADYISQYFLFAGVAQVPLEQAMGLEEVTAVLESADVSHAPAPLAPEAAAAAMNSVFGGSVGSSDDTGADDGGTTLRMPAGLGLDADDDGAALFAGDGDDPCDLPAGD